MSQAQDASYQPKPKVIETPERVGEGFDLRTHISDAKTGQLIRMQPYRMFCEGRIRYFERPKMSGNLFYESGEVAGRRVQVEGKWKIDETLKHTEFTSAKTDLITPDQVFSENEELRKELAAMRAEKEASIKAEKAAPLQAVQAAKK